MIRLDQLALIQNLLVQAPQALFQVADGGFGVADVLFQLLDLGGTGIDLGLGDCLGGAP